MHVNNAQDYLLGAENGKKEWESDAETIATAKKKWAFKEVHHLSAIL